MRSPRKSGSTPSDKEIRAILARKERKGLTYAQVSRETGIPVGTLASWGQRPEVGWKFGARALPPLSVEMVASS